jgi:hypothetical protein
MAMEFGKELTLQDVPLCRLQHYRALDICSTLQYLDPNQQIFEGHTYRKWQQNGDFISWY